MTFRITDEIKENRKPGHDINPLIIGRWSPRAMSGENLSDEELMPLFEAARWAPSASNKQPWRFIYAKRETEHWDRFFDLLIDFNKLWAKNASVLALIISEKSSDTHSFDAGAAWENLALEAASRGLVAHGMAGFDYEKAKDVLDIPDDFRVEAMIAIGKRAPKEVLPERMRKSEVPSPRKLLEEIVIEGKFRV